MKKLYQNFISPTPANVLRWQKITGVCGMLLTAISAGGAMYDFVPTWFVHALGWGTLISIVRMQFKTVNKEA